jgi:hypothetical protein
MHRMEIGGLRHTMLMVEGSLDVIDGSISYGESVIESTQEVGFTYACHILQIRLATLLYFSSLSHPR